ncbi:MAG: aldehyde-activating protein [Lysobacteraceae bacterium]|nr:MAG: aldehyde-activating protein [Xanthomonadaceae bacterium]
MNDKVTFEGGCHCGAVRFAVIATEPVQLTRCNCSICSMTGFLHLIVGADQFKLLTSQKALTDYRFNTGQAKHLFCATCGVKSFYVPRSHPDGYSINAHCLRDFDIDKAEISDFDGQNWEANIRSLS